MAYDSYPSGMSRNDLIHVGEIDDGWEAFYENYCPTDLQLSEYIEQYPGELVDLFNEKWKQQQGLTLVDLMEWWIEHNHEQIETDFERQQ
jgi:hypothetical protein